MPTLTLGPPPTAVREVTPEEWAALVDGGELPGWPEWTVRLSCRVRVAARGVGRVPGENALGKGAQVDSDQRLDRGLVAVVTRDLQRGPRHVQVCEAVDWWHLIDALTALPIGLAGVAGRAVGSGEAAWSGRPLPPWCEVGWEWLMGLERARRIGRGDLWQESVATGDGPLRVADPRTGRWTSVSAVSRAEVLRALQGDRLAEVRVLTAIAPGASGAGTVAKTGCVGWWLYPDGWRRVRTYRLGGRDRLLVQRVTAGHLAGDVFAQTYFARTRADRTRSGQAQSVPVVTR